MGQRWDKQFVPPPPATSLKGVAKLWSVEFVSSLQVVGAGVVVIETGKVLGGDGRYFYVGSYEKTRDGIKARLKVVHYSGEPHSIFGPAQHFEIDVAGKPARQQFDLIGHVVGRPDLQIHIRLTRRAELP